MDYARGIRIARSITGVSKKELAHSIGVNPSYISRLEAGNRIPSNRVLPSIARALGFPLHLFGFLCYEKADMKHNYRGLFHTAGYELLELIVKLPRTHK